MINIAVVGTGSIGQMHLTAIEKCDYCRLTAICDTNEEKARSIAEKYGVSYFTDYRDIRELPMR